MNFALVLKYSEKMVFEQKFALLLLFFVHMRHFDIDFYGAFDFLVNVSRALGYESSLESTGSWH